jgi:PAS domain S-box-containing protein
MQFEELLATFMQSIVANLRPDRCFLFASKDQVNQAVAIGGLHQPLQILPQIPTANAPVAHNIIDTVIDSGNAVVIRDLTIAHPFSEDNYCRQSKARSIICLPAICQQHVVAILYLEHQTSYPFAIEGLGILQGLCQQVAISLTQFAECQRLITYTQSLENQIAEHCLATDPESLTPKNLNLEELPHVDTQPDRVVRLSEYKFRQLVENANDLIFSITLDGRFTYLSPKFQEMCGYEPAQFMGLSFSHLAHPDDVASMYEMLRGQLLKRDKLTGFECRIRHKNGHYIWITSNHSAPIEDANGKLVGFQGIVRDITERKQTEERLQLMNDQLLISNAELARATRLKDEFLANMSHELRTPLNSILGITEAMLEQPYGHLVTRYQKSLQMISNSGEHLLDLINDILDLAKIEAGKLELNITETYLHHLCESSINFVKQLALNKGLKLNCQVLVDCPTIVADERRWRQVLINLLSNAVKFTPAGGTVTLTVEADRAAQNLLFQVQDTGIGIAPEKIQSLFQPFMQIDSSLNRQYSGTGLGLVLVKRIVDLHGGVVQVHSQVHQGSCFTISLPCTNFAANSVVHPITPPQSSSHFTTMNQSTSQLPQSDNPLVLLAEDNKMNIEMFSDYLDHHGYQLIIAENGVEAVEMARQQQPQLILMDIQMPKMDGLEAIRQIRQETPLVNTPIVALTALAMPGDAQKCLEAGANDYLSKPVKLKELVGLMQTLLPKD